MRIVFFALFLAACAATPPAATTPPPAPQACRAEGSAGVSRWLDLETCKTALVAPCPEGQRFTTDACGCYCLAEMPGG